MGTLLQVALLFCVGLKHISKSNGGNGDAGVVMQLFILVVQCMEIFKEYTLH